LALEKSFKRAFAWAKPPFFSLRNNSRFGKVAMFTLDSDSLYSNDIRYSYLAGPSMSMQAGS